MNDAHNDDDDDSAAGALQLKRKRRVRPTELAKKPLHTTDQDSVGGDLLLVPCIVASATPHMALMLQFDVERLFSDALDAQEADDARSERASKTKSLRRLVGHSSKTKNSARRLERDACLAIQSESDRLCAFILEQDDAFVQLFICTLGRSVCAHASAQIHTLAPFLMLDHSVTAHARLIKQRMFDTRLLVRVGDARLVEYVYRETAQLGYTSAHAERRLATIKGYLASFVSARVSDSRLLHALPMGWRLHPQTHRALSEREIEEQEQRILTEFPLLIAGLLAYCGLNDWLAQFLRAILQECC